LFCQIGLQPWPGSMPQAFAKYNFGFYLPYHLCYCWPFQNWLHFLENLRGLRPQLQLYQLDENTHEQVMEWDKIQSYLKRVCLKGDSNLNKLYQFLFLRWHHYDFRCQVLNGYAVYWSQNFRANSFVLIIFLYI
jgi:hypothetical protein